MNTFQNEFFFGLGRQEIQPGGIWGQDGRLKEGDQILSVNGRSLDSAQVPITHQEVIDILQQAQGRVELVVARACPRSPGKDQHGGGRRSRSPRTVRRLSSGSTSSAHRPSSAMVLNTKCAKVEVSTSFSFSSTARVVVDVDFLPFCCYIKSYICYFLL
jgi:hypothetical protein